MTSLAELLVGLIRDLPADVDDASHGVRVAVTGVELQLPIESRLSAGRFGASLPRGHWQSGVELPPGLLHARFDRTFE